LSSRFKKLMPHILEVPTALLASGCMVATPRRTLRAAFCAVHTATVIPRISNCAPVVLDLIQKIAAATSTTITIEPATQIRAHALGVKL
jgi:hypothetical protein